MTSTITDIITTTAATTTALLTEPVDSCDISHTLGYVAIGVVFGLSVTGCLAPTLIQRFFPRIDVLHHPFFRFCQGLAAGFVVGVALVHSFPDAVDDLGSEEAGLPDYAWGGLFALLGLLGTWTCEAFIAVYLQTTAGGHHDHKPDDAVELGEMGQSAPKKEEGHCDHALEEVISREQQTKNYSSMIILLFGLTFHSVFVGFAIGLSEERNLFIAVLCHQFFEALAIGFHMVRARTIKKPFFALLLILIFSTSAPIGTGIGIGVSVSICQSPGTFAIVAGVFNALAAGILIYVASVHMIAEEASKPDVLKSRVKAFLLWLGVVIGMAIMSVIGIWA